MLLSLESREEESREPASVWIWLDSRLPSPLLCLLVDLPPGAARLIGLLRTRLHAPQIVLDLLDLLALFSPLGNDLLLGLPDGLLDLLALLHHLLMALAHDLTICAVADQYPRLAPVWSHNCRLVLHHGGSHMIKRGAMLCGDDWSRGA